MSGLVPAENQQNCFLKILLQESKKSYLTPLKNLNYDILLPIRESFYTVRLRREHSLALHNPENFNVGSKSRLDAIFFRPL